MLVELAIGDAYGAGFEYASPQIVYSNNNLRAYIPHPKHPIIPGHYTDDTQMSIAIAEAIIEQAQMSGRERECSENQAHSVVKSVHITDWLYSK